MRISLNLARYLVAAGVLSLGGVWAASIFQRPASVPGPDPQQLEMLAARAGQFELAAPVVLSAPPPRPRAPRPSSTVPVTSRPAVQVTPTPPPVKPAEIAPTVIPTVSPADAAVKQIALMGVTQQGDEMSAWLVDLSTQAREVAEAGDSAFGFSVKDVDSESVVLTQNGEEFTVRLGEKEIPVGVVETPAVVTTNQSVNNFGGRGGNRSWRNSGRSYTSGNSNRSNSNSSSNSNRNRSSDRGNSRRNSGRSSNGGGFGGGFSGGFSGGSGRGNRVQSFMLPSSNPQEARRRGVSFIGEGDPLPQPAQILNPQTQRRRGSASGPAFGAANSGNRTNTNNRR